MESFRLVTSFGIAVNTFFSGIFYFYCRGGHSEQTHNKTPWGQFIRPAESRTHTYYWPGKGCHPEHNIICWIFKNHQIIPLFMASFIYYSVWSIPTTFPFYSNSNEKKNSCHVAQNNDWLNYLSITALNIYIRSFMDLCSFEDIWFILLLQWILLGKKIMNEPKNLGLMLFKIYMWEVELFPVSLFVLSWFYATFEIYNSSSWGAHWWMSPVGKRGGGCCWVEKEGAPRNNFFLVWFLTQKTNWGSSGGEKLPWLYIGWNFYVILPTFWCLCKRHGCGGHR